MLDNNYYNMPKKYDIPTYENKIDNRYLTDDTNPHNQNEPQKYKRVYKEYRNPFEEDDYPYDEKPNKHSFIYISIIIICVVLIGGILLFLLPQISGKIWKGMDNYAFVNGSIISYKQSNTQKLEQYWDYTKRDTIFPGVYIDGLHVGDVTVQEAKEMLLSGKYGNSKTFSVTVSIGDKSWLIDNEKVDITRNLGNVLDQAYAVGRRNTTILGGTNFTPLQQRFDLAIKLRSSGKSFYTEWVYNKEDVKVLTDHIAEYIQRDAIDSQIESFDFASRSFKFTQDSSGLSIDADELYNKVIDACDDWSQNALVTVEPKIIPADTTKIDMMNNFKLVAAYTTKTSNISNRNTNIDLASRAINGTVLMPGEEFSFNETTGQRTSSKGYKSAAAIAGGEVNEEIGGGVCQVSTTLFNAVARADLEIVYRSGHAWPSSYIEIGEDATVNWPNLDFKFKNNKSTPVFIVMYYNDRHVSAEIFGISLGEGITIDLVSKLVKTTNPPSEPAYVEDPELPIGTEKTTIKARTGYTVDTYKVWYRNKEEFKREKMYTTVYKPYQQTISYNYGSGF